MALYSVGMNTLKCAHKVGGIHAFMLFVLNNMKAWILQFEHWSCGGSRVPGALGPSARTGVGGLYQG